MLSKLQKDRILSIVDNIWWTFDWFISFPAVWLLFRLRITKPANENVDIWKIRRQHFVLTESKKTHCLIKWLKERKREREREVSDFQYRVWSIYYMTDLVRRFGVCVCELASISVIRYEYVVFMLMLLHIGLYHNKLFCSTVLF